MGAIPPNEIPSGLVWLLESLAEKLDLGVGDARLEVILADGRLRGIYKHVRVDRQELEQRFPGQPPPA